MKILCDTNLLIRTAKPDDPSHAVALAALDYLAQLGHQPVLVPQCIYEYYVVATRPLKNNGLGMDQATVATDIDDLIMLIPLFVMNVQSLNIGGKS